MEYNRKEDEKAQQKNGKNTEYKGKQMEIDRNVMKTVEN